MKPYLLAYKSMSDLKQETIIDREILCKNDWQQLKSEIWVH